MRPYSGFKPTAKSPLGATAMNESSPKETQLPAQEKLRSLSTETPETRAARIDAESRALCLESLPSTPPASTKTASSTSPTEDFLASLYSPHSLSHRDRFRSNESYIKFVDGPLEEFASSEAEALKYRRERLAELQATASASTDSTLSRVQSHLFAEKIITLPNHVVLLLNFVACADKRDHAITPLNALAFYNFKSLDGHAVEFQHLVEGVRVISAQHKSCMPFVLTDAMRAELKANRVADYDGVNFSVTSHLEKVRQFYQVIYTHWDKAYEELKLSTEEPEMLDAAYDKLQIFLKHHEQAALDYVRLFRKMATPYKHDGRELPDKTLEESLRISQERATRREYFAALLKKSIMTTSSVRVAQDGTTDEHKTDSTIHLKRH